MSLSQDIESIKADPDILSSVAKLLSCVPMLINDAVTDAEVGPDADFARFTALADTLESRSLEILDAIKAHTAMARENVN